MGFLDHSTNNIIVDAVLTDTGRQLLAANDGSFRISQFALGDDEVDYGIIKKFGRNVGQEKIEKNTPIMEALTRSNLGLKYRIVSVSNSYLTYFPVLEVTSGGSAYTESTGVLNFNNASSENNDRTSSMTFTVTPKESTSIDDDLLDEEFFIEVNNIFLKILNDSPDIVNIDNTVVYRVGTTTDSSTGNPQVIFSLALKGFSTNQFNTYSISAGTSASYVKTFIKLTGATSGLTKIVEARITNSN
jgi:hypothetical protein